ncbi:MAG: phosphodiester glycosidase family protein [Oscillospiraceae bacterium]|nr:phosphodiester glycosidase family protein [Oscillospiraceae bacterium]
MERKEQAQNLRRKGLQGLWILFLALAGTVLTAGMLAVMLMSKTTSESYGGRQTKAKIIEQFDMYMTNTVSDALDGVLAVEKVYWLNDEDMVAPEPNPELYGETTDPADLQEVIDRAQVLLDGQELLFRTDIELEKGSKIKYYLDDTILAITWREKVGMTEYTFSEVKIAHPSQFRRFLSGGEYGSGLLYTTTEMAESVNAVAAASGDYYSYRGFGNVIYNGEVKRSGDRLLDTCYIDANGDLLFSYVGDVMKKAELEQFVAENNIRFSLAFGPVMIRDGQVTAKYSYNIGETADRYSRAALCQHGPLHYIMVAANRRGMPVKTFAEYLQGRGIHTAYALDGGQTASIVTGGELMNDVDYGGERDISDIIYFATALPNGG